MTTEIKKKVAYDVVGETITRQVLVPQVGPVVVIATYVNGVVTMDPAWWDYRNTVKRMLNEKAMTAVFAKIDVPPRPPKPEPVAVVVEGQPLPVTETATVGADVPPALTVDPLSGLTTDQRKAINYLRSKEGLSIVEVESNPPKAPRFTAGAGDKEPAYVKWLLRYFPREFAERYGVIGLGSVEKVAWVIDHETRQKTRRRTREPGHVIARRATIFTNVLQNVDDLEGGDS